MEQTPSCGDNGAKSRSSSNTKRSGEKRLSKKNCDISCKSKKSVKRKLKTFSFGRWQRGLNKEKVKNFNLNHDTYRSSVSIVSESSVESVTCICTGYRRTKVVTSSPDLVVNEEVIHVSSSEAQASSADSNPGPSSYNFDEESNSPDKVEENKPVSNSVTVSYHPTLALNRISMDQLALALTSHLALSTVTFSYNPLLRRYSEIALPYPSATGNQIYSTSAHTQIDYVHHLVPALQEITNCSFYWGKMDRYKAEKQLEEKAEGTFLLRDSAQEEFLFSVSFRRYGRTLHARVEQINHRFSFDSHDPNVFSAPTVCELIEHYKNPRCCMYFEPMLTIPVHRKFPFSLSNLCRAVISDHITYDNINQLKLPKRIKSFLKEYHYKQKVKVRNLEHDV